MIAGTNWKRCQPEQRCQLVSQTQGYPGEHLPSSIFQAAYAVVGRVRLKMDLLEKEKKKTTHKQEDKTKRYLCMKFSHLLHSPPLREIFLIHAKSTTWHLAEQLTWWKGAQTLRPSALSFHHLQLCWAPSSTGCKQLMVSGEGQSTYFRAVWYAGVPLGFRSLTKSSWHVQNEWLSLVGSKAKKYGKRNCLYMMYLLLHNVIDGI